MDDRELLERAARAAGRSDWDHAPNIIGDEGGPTFWNPLEDDGDALRLAVKLGISIVHRRTYADDTPVAVAAARWSDDYDQTETMYGEDAGAATRRAIVSAAASLAEGEAK